MKKLFSFVLLIALFSISCNKQKITQTQVTTLAESTKSWNGVPLPAYKEGQPKVTILKIVIPPQTKLKLHEHPVINAGVLLKGELTVVCQNNDTLHLKAGEPIVEVVNTWHYGINEGKKPAEIIVFYAGTEDTPITVLEE